MFDGLSEGTYRVIASLGEQTAEKDVQVRSNEEKPLTLLLKEASSVRLHLLDGVAGQPPRWYEAPLYDAAGRLVLSKKRRSPDDGLISLPVSGDGPFTAVVASGGHGIVTVRELHAGASPRTVSLMPGSELILQGADQDRGQFWLMDGQGHPLALNSSTPPGAMPFVGPVTILDDLPAGRYVARYTARDSTQTGPWEIQLKPQAPTFLELKP